MRRVMSRSPGDSRRSSTEVVEDPPREVDEVLMDHPSTDQVITFAVPHDKRGEDVAAAVVLREGVTLAEKTFVNLPRGGWPTSRSRAR